MTSLSRGDASAPKSALWDVPLVTTNDLINSTSFSRLAVVLMAGCQAGYVPPGPRYECPALPLHKDLLYPCKCTSGSDAGLYVTCDQTNLASLSVGLANLGSLNYPVEELIISSCNFGKITRSMQVCSTVNEKKGFCIVWYSLQTFHYSCKI